MASKVVEIDGAMLEGGGQILRMAISLSALLRQPVQVFDIRAGRSKPGLGAQHMAGLHLVRDICGGRLTGDKIGSTKITFHPSLMQGGDFSASTGTAGSVGLLMQVALPCLIFGNAPSVMTLEGGTNADMAPPIDFFNMAFIPIMKHFGFTFELDILKRGFFPEGGGIVRICTNPIDSLKPVEILERGNVKQITGCSYVAGKLPLDVAHKMAESAENILKGHLPNTTIRIQCVKEPFVRAFGTGSGIILDAETTTGCHLTGSALGSKKVISSPVGASAANMLLSNLKYNACVDDYLQDQIIIYMALANGKSKVRCGPVTLHTQTAIHVAKLLTQAKFNIVKDNDESYIIECDGIGFKRN